MLIPWRVCVYVTWFSIGCLLGCFCLPLLLKNFPDSFEGKLGYLAPPLFIDSPDSDSYRGSYFQIGFCYLGSMLVKFIDFLFI